MSYVYAATLDSVPNLRSFVQDGAENFASWYKSHKNAALAGLEQVVDTYQGIVD